MADFLSKKYIDHAVMRVICGGGAGPRDKKVLGLGGAGSGTDTSLLSPEWPLCSCITADCYRSRAVAPALTGKYGRV